MTTAVSNSHGEDALRSSAARRILVEPFSVVAAATSTRLDESELVFSAWKCSWESHLRNNNDHKRHVWRDHPFQIVANFIDEARKEHGYETFIARDPKDGSTLGLIACQKWNGPVPIRVLNCFSLGNLWGLQLYSANRRNEVAKALIQTALEHLRTLGCQKAVVLALGGFRRELVDSGFRPANMLTRDLRNLPYRANFRTKDNCVEITTAGPEADEIVRMNWRKMWLENGIPAQGFVENFDQLTQEFLQHARDNLKYQTIVAKTQDGSIVGTISCQIWRGPFPKIVQPHVFELGTVWAVYVNPEMRRRGIATVMMQAALRHLKEHKCDSAILIAASEAGQRVYERVGFAPNSALVYDYTAKPDSNKKIQGSPCDMKALSKELQGELESIGVDCLDSGTVRAMVTATTRQLVSVFGDHPQSRRIFEAAREFQTRHGLYICPEDNWFTQNVKRFGRGFDLKVLADPHDLATKFDRLSTRYDHWTIGNRSKVEKFVVGCAKQRLPAGGSANLRLLDVACGIGIQGQTLRLCGFRGRLIGTDISAGMISRVQERGCYDQAYVANANEPFNFAEEYPPFDVCLCTGAMELLDQETVLASMAGITKDGGELWVSFQHAVRGAEDKACSTSHQNVRGITKESAIQKLTNAGYRVLSIDECNDAFFTPSPTQDGSLLPVPYLFCVAKKNVSF